MSAAKYVLVIDDDSDAREILIKILSTLGIATASAEDGKEAVALALLRTPTAIILDLMMPHMNGFEFLYWLRSQPKLRHVPVIVVSGYLGEFELPELSGLEFIEKGQMRARQVRQKVNYYRLKADSFGSD